METPTKPGNKSFNITEPIPFSSDSNPVWNPSSYTRPQSSQMQTTNEIPPPDALEDIELSRISLGSNTRSNNRADLPGSVAPSRSSTMPQYQSFVPYTDNLPSSKPFTASRVSSNAQLSTRRSMSFASPPVEIKPGLMSSVNNGPFRGPIEDQSEIRYLGADYLADSEFRNRYKNTEISEERFSQPPEPATGPIRMAELRPRDIDRYRSLPYEQPRKPTIYDLKYQQAMNKGPLQWRKREGVERIPVTQKERPVQRPDIKKVNKKAKQLASRNPRAWYNPALGGNFIQPNLPPQQPNRPLSKSHISLPDSVDDIFTNGARANPALFLKNPEFDARYVEPSHLTEAHGYKKFANIAPKNPEPLKSKRPKLDNRPEPPHNLAVHEKFSPPRRGPRVIDASPKLLKPRALETQERHKAKDFNESLNNRDRVPPTPGLISSISEVKSPAHPPKSIEANRNIETGSSILPSDLDSEMRSPRAENDGNKSVNNSLSMNEQGKRNPGDNTISNVEPYNVLGADPLMRTVDLKTSSFFQSPRKPDTRKNTRSASGSAGDANANRPSSIASLEAEAGYSHINYLVDKLRADSTLSLKTIPDKRLSHRNYMSSLEAMTWTLQRKFAQVLVWSLTRVICHNTKNHIHEVVSFYLCEFRVKMITSKISIPFSLKFSTLSHLKPLKPNSANRRYARILDQLVEKASGLQIEAKHNVETMEASQIPTPQMRSINEIRTDFGVSQCNKYAQKLQSRLIEFKKELCAVQMKFVKCKDRKNTERNRRESY